MSNMNAGFEFDWDSTVEYTEGNAFTILPDGDYNFEVLSYERQRYSPKEGGQIPACAMAVVKLRIGDGMQVTTLEDRLYLHSSFAWKLCQFFVAIGLSKKGENFTPRWNMITGTKGRCRLGTRKWKNRNGEEQTSNQINEYYEYAPAQGYTAPPSNGGYNGGF